MAAEEASAARVLSEEQQSIMNRIGATMQFMAGNPDEAQAVVAWLEWQLNGMLDHVGFDDFSPSELVAYVGLIGPVFARVLNRETGPRVRANFVGPRPLHLV